MRLLQRSSVVSALVLLAVGTLAAGQWVRSAAARDRRRLVVANLRQPATSLVFVAQDLGCFGREGLRIDERTFDLGKDALVSLTNGQVDVAIAYETAALRTYQHDGRLRALGTLHTSTRNTRILARRDAGIEAAADLRGARIGVPLGTNAAFFLDTLVTFAGIGRGQVKIVDLSPERAVAAISRGELPAVALFDPYASEAQAALGPLAVEILSDLYTEYSLVTTRDDVIASRRGELAAFLAGLVCAERAVRDGDPAAFQAVQRRLPDRSEAQLRVALGRVKRTVTLDGLLMAVLRRESDWIRAVDGVSGTAPDPAGLVDASLLEEVDPEAVNIPASPERAWRR